jgi:hypothetical protein
MATQRRGNFLGGLARADEIAGAEGNGCYASVSAAAVFLAEGREIHIGGGFFPRVGSY